MTLPYPLQSWWDTVDMLACNVVGPLVACWPDRLQTVMDQWVADDNMWLRRTALLHQLKYGADTDASRLFRYCTLCMHEPDFFIRKAVGWTLRNYGYHDPDAVRSFVRENRATLSPLSIREALKHIGTGEGEGGVAAPSPAKRSRQK
jgi:3-methyladenine DNA glycosylase AlkD